MERNMGDMVQLSQFSASQNPLLESMESLKKDKMFRVSKWVYGTHKVSGKQLCLLLIIHLLSVLCVSAFTTVVTTRIMGVTTKGCNGLQDKNCTADCSHTPNYHLKPEKLVRDSLEHQKEENGSINEIKAVGDKGSRDNKGLKCENEISWKIRSKCLKDLTREKGHIGHRGPTGNKGPIGVKGLRGGKGQSGSKCVVGDKGSTGEKGPKGENGVNGDKGLAGENGQKGENGVNGDKGLAGEKGPKGENGLKGEKGSKGSTAFERSCETGWFPFGKYCYYVEKTDRKTWQDAQTDCEQRNGNLVKIENALENWVLKSFSRDGGLERAWIGANDLYTEGHMVWVSDKTYVSAGFSDWAPGEPNNGRTLEHCVHFYPDDSYKWNDSVCRDENAYICKK